MNWENVEWSSVLEIKNGKSQKKVIDENGQFPIYGSGGIMGHANDYLCEPGTTIIGRKGSINNPIFVSTKFWNVDTAFGLCPGNSLDNKFFYYFCLTYNFLKHNKATTLPSLTKSDLLKIKIPLPPLPIQKKIAAILDAADDFRLKTKALIEKYDELTQSLFLDMFGDPVRNEKGWEMKPIIDLVKRDKNSIKRGPFGSALKKEIFVEKGYLVYEQFHALNNNFEFARYYIDEAKFNELKGFEVKEGDIIISCSGVYLGFADFLVSPSLLTVK